MNEKFYAGFEKQASWAGMLGAVKSGFGAAKNLARTSGMTSSARALGRNLMRGNFGKATRNVGMLGRSAGRAVGRVGTAVGQRLDPRLASVRAMNKKVQTSSRNLMNSAQKRF